MQRLLIQPDWDDLLNENSDEYFWVQYKFSQAPAINSKLTFVNKDENYDIDNSRRNNPFSVTNFSKEQKTVEISYKKDNEQIIKRKFVSAVQKFCLHFNKKNEKQPVINLDVTSGGLGVSSSTDGSILIWLTENGQIRRYLDGHVSDVNVSKFFPSGLVVLSGGADLRLKVWSAEDGSCPVTLVGHTSGINDVGFVERGKNIVSVGRDGQCKLFNVGESRCVATIAKYDSIVNGCCIQSLSESNLQYFEFEKSILSEPDIQIDNKIVALACEDGYLRVISLGAKKQIAEFNCQSAVNCCCFLNETHVCCGTQNGFIFLFDLIGDEIKSWREFRSAILSISPIGGKNGFIASTADGSCFSWDLNEANDSIVDFTGPDCDPVYKVVYNQTHVFTCCRDGVIRKYNLNGLF